MLSEKEKEKVLSLCLPLIEHKAEKNQWPEDAKQEAYLRVFEIIEERDELGYANEASFRSSMHRLVDDAAEKALQSDKEFREVNGKFYYDCVGTSELDLLDKFTAEEIIGAFMHEYKDVDCRRVISLLAITCGFITLPDFEQLATKLARFEVYPCVTLENVRKRLSSDMSRLRLTANKVLSDRVSERAALTIEELFSMFGPEYMLSAGGNGYESY